MKKEIIKRSTASSEIERRYHEGNEDKASFFVRGYASLYDTPSDRGGWYTERIAPNAFDEALESTDVRALLNHDPNHVLARYKSGRENNTLELKSDDKGLYFEFQMPESRQDLIEAALRGDITQNSFAFRIEGEEWSEEKRTIDGEEVSWPVRTITKIKDLVDVSLVTYPFYEEASFEIERNSYDAWKGDKKAELAEEIWKTYDQVKRDMNVTNKINEAVIRFHS